MDFIELTSFVGGLQGYADEPMFDRQLWPLLLKNQHVIPSVFLFRHELSNVAAEFLEDYKVISPNIVALGPMARLSSERLKRLSYLSFFGGHLSVLYQTHYESPLVPELFGQYPQSGRLSNDATDTLGLDGNARFELAMFVEALSADMLIASFAHDADPLYIFGKRPALATLL